MRTDHRKNIFVADLREGQQVNDLFLVSRKNLAETKSGNPYLALTLMDSSGEIEARAWDDAARLNDLAEVGRVVLVDGQVKPFRDQLQLTVNSLQTVAEGAVSLDSFMPVSKRSVREMEAELAGIIDSLTDAPLQQLLRIIFRGELLEQFSMAPAAKMMHHAYLGGLLEHTLSVTGLAQHIAQHYPVLDRNLLVTGALLHDLGKVREFNFSTVPFEYTDSGRLIGHLVLGGEMIRQHADTVPALSADRLEQLIHLVLSHHGRYEFGSPCLPQTLEAILLHHLDDMDAKVNYIDRLSEQVAPGEQQWSEYQRPLERFLLLTGPAAESAGRGEPSVPPTADHEQEKVSDRNEDRSNKSSRQHSLF